MSRVHEAYFPDFSFPELSPNPNSSLKANIIHHLSRNGIRSCLIEAASYAVKNRHALLPAWFGKPASQVEAQQKSVMRSTGAPRPEKQVGKSHEMALGSETLPSQSMRALERYPDHKGLIQYLLLGGGWSSIVTSVVNTVPVVDLNFSVRSRSSKASIFELGAEDGLLLPLGGAARRKVSSSSSSSTVTTVQATAAPAQAPFPSPESCQAKVAG